MVAADRRPRVLQRRSRSAARTSVDLLPGLPPGRRRARLLVRAGLDRGARRRPVGRGGTRLGPDQHVAADRRRARDRRRSRPSRTHARRCDEIAAGTALHAGGSSTASRRPSSPGRRRRDRPRRRARPHPPRRAARPSRRPRRSPRSSSLRRQVVSSRPGEPQAPPGSATGRGPPEARRRERGEQQQRRRRGEPRRDLDALVRAADAGAERLVDLRRRSTRSGRCRPCRRSPRRSARIVGGSGGTGIEFMNAPKPNVTLPFGRAERDG